MQKHATFTSKSQSICGKQEYFSAEFGRLPIFLESADALFQLPSRLQEFRQEICKLVTYW